MALQTSGAISLNDIHVEVGGSSGTSVGINDTDIRNLTGVSSQASSSFNSFYGASAVWNRTMTVGHTGNTDLNNGTGYMAYHYDPFNGNLISGSPAGSLSPNTTFDTGATIQNLDFRYIPGIKGLNQLAFHFSLLGTLGNSGWNNIIMDNGSGGTVSVARSACIFLNVAANEANSGTVAHTRWTLSYTSGADGDAFGNTGPALQAQRSSYFRSNTTHSFPIEGATPLLNWTLGKQIKVTIG